MRSGAVGASMRSSAVTAVMVASGGIMYQSGHHGLCMTMIQKEVFIVDS
jgi:hypothetical protein